MGGLFRLLDVLCCALLMRDENPKGVRLALFGQHFQRLSGNNKRI
jgi:hypothetical protein